MPATLARAPKKSLESKSPHQYRWTRRQVLKLCKAGWFDDARIMLLDGRIYEMPVAYPPHDFALVKLFNYLQSIVPASCYVRNQLGLGLSPRTDPAPDLAVVKGKIEDHWQEHPAKALFVAEIADSSLRIDKRIKAELYAQSGVPEYWILDLTNRQLIVHRDPIADATAPRGHCYATILTLAAEESVAPLAKPDAIVKVADFLPPVSS